MRFGIFLAPFHPVGQSPTLALQRDLELIQRLDQLGYDEAWIGEHHSAGFEIIASPEVFIAAAAERTKRIRLGTGVSSLPYHQPLMLADRMVLLDHLTRGRVMLGVGPGALPSDAFMMGIDPVRQRPMMEEALEAILALLAGDEPVTRKTDWFELRDARLQLRPYQPEGLPVGVAAPGADAALLRAVLAVRHAAVPEPDAIAGELTGLGRGEPRAVHRCGHHCRAASRADPLQREGSQASGRAVLTTPNWRHGSVK